MGQVLLYVNEEVESKDKNLCHFFKKKKVHKEFLSELFTMDFVNLLCLKRGVITC